MHRVSSLTRTAALIRKWTGLQAQRERQTRGALVLVYHGVAKNLRGDELDTYQVSQSELRRHVHYLKSFAEIIPISALLKNDGVLFAGQQRFVSITFDDALLSQVTLAADVMSDLNVPWSIAVPAGLVDQQQPVWTNWVRVMTSLLPPDKRPLVGGRRLDHAMLQSSGSMLIHHLMHHVTSEQRDQQIQELQDSVGEERVKRAIEIDGRFLMATWSQLRHVVTTGCETLSHGWTHRPHNHLISDNDRLTEIVESRRLIEQKLGVAPKGFAYPHGITSDASASLLADAGYAFALSTKASWFTKVDRWNVPRFDGEYTLNVLRRHLTCRQ